MQTNKFHIVLSAVTIALLMHVGGGALASSDGALTEYERNLKLYNDGFISRAELDESKSKYQTEYERNLKLYNDGFISRAELDKYEKAYLTANGGATSNNKDKDVSNEE